MTCIIGLVENGKVYIGGDSAGSDGWIGRQVLTPKVFQVGKMLIGYTDSFRLGQLLQYRFNPTPQADNETDEHYIVSVVVEAIRSVLKDGGYAKVENSVEHGGNFLIGYREHIYEIQSDLSAIEHADHFNAIGSGEQFALAAMRALENLPPVERIQKALEITAEFSVYVKPPFTVLEL